MPKKVYLGSSTNLAQKVKKMYVGVDGVARKVKKAYVGVNGIARLFWSGTGKLVYHGTATSLSQARDIFAATTVGDYALFGGGVTGIYAYSNVDAYNTSLTKSTATSLSQARGGLAATTVGDYALFAGGMYEVGLDGSGLITVSTVSSYNTSLTRTTRTSLSQSRTGLKATTVGNYALFAGGYYYNYYEDENEYGEKIISLAKPSTSTVDAYDQTLTRSTPTTLSAGRSLLAATTVGNYALFAGGGAVSSDFGALNTVDAYNTSLTRTTPTVLSAEKRNITATTLGNFAIFAGGKYQKNILSSITYYTTPDVYNTSLTRSTATAMSKGRANPAATTVGDYSLIAGGHNGDNGGLYVSPVDVYKLD